jgi:DNA-binding NarL/FixJ family response regulator
VADDHPVVREDLNVLIDAQPDTAFVGAEGDGRSVVRMARDLRPDLIVMDFSMPGVSEAEVLERIKQELPDVRVVALTIYDDAGYLRRLFQAGASGYVAKAAPVADLIDCIRALASGSTFVDPTLASRSVAHASRGRPSRKARRDEVLTQRETKVVRLVAMGHTQREIAEKLEISVKTVET